MREIGKMSKDGWYLEGGAVRLGKPGAAAFGGKTDSARARPGAAQKGRPSLARVAFGKNRIARDENGCFLGVFDESEVGELWPDATPVKLVYSVPRTVEFEDALRSIERTTRAPTDRRHRQLERSIRDAVEGYPLDGMSGPAEGYWESQATVAWSVVGGSGESLCVVPYETLDRFFGKEWFCAAPNVAQLTRASGSSAARKAVEYVRVAYEGTGRPGSTYTRLGIMRLDPLVPARQESRDEWPSRCVVRDENGCFLGVHTLDEAILLWPSAKSSGALISVPETVSFASAVMGVESTQSLEISFAQRRYRDSVRAACRFATDHEGEPAEEHWLAALDRPVNVVINRDEPVGRATPRELAEVLGDGWFVVDDDLVQVMNTWGVGRVVDALRPLLEDSNVPEPPTAGMRHIRDAAGDIVASCDQDAFAKTYRNLLRHLPAGSYTLERDGVRLRGDYGDLGYSSREELALACGEAAASGTQFRSAADWRTNSPSRFAVNGADGRKLYGCSPMLARKVRPFVESNLPEGSYRRVERGVQLLVGVEELGFASAASFGLWCAKCERGKRLRPVSPPRQRNARGRSARPRAREPLGNPSFSGPEQVLHVFKGTIACRRRNHRIESATGTVVTLGGRELRINANWCRDCGMYFLGHGEYMHYREAYGPILGNFKFDGAGYSTGDGFGALAEESPLMLCGYSASEAEGLSEGQRHLILANAMDRGICPKHRVIEYLRFFIRSRRNLPNMKRAIAKWEADLRWVRSYRIDGQRRFTVGEVRRFR